jgi:hypothetical protein
MSPTVFLRLFFLALITLPAAVQGDLVVSVGGLAIVGSSEY